MWWIILAIVLLVPLALLLLPLGVDLSYMAGRFRFMLILAGLHISVPQRIVARVRRGMSRTKPVQPKSETDAPAPDLADIWGGIRDEAGGAARLFGLRDLRSMLDFVIRMLRTLHIRVRQLHVRIASPDPAWTGAVYGWSCALVSSLPPDWPVSVEADWSGEVPQASFRVEISVIPVRVLATLIGIFYRNRVLHSH